jgi:chromosome segregation protein
MKLRRLHLHGFKTFARRSEVEFDPGITAVVGPNGSGKSNVIDAIRWALGETNARELRGARMDEVIFSGGSGSRGRMQLAEVELTFEKEDGSELALHRRVARGTESEYRIDGERTRLRDIDKLLDGTGLAQSGYSVIAQNDIDAIIQATPSQRRALVEQAAGIRMIRAATDDSLNRIARVRTTQQRLDDFLREAEPRLAELAQQSAAALEQREMTERLTELRGNLAREEWRAARGQLRQATRRHEHAKARFQETRDADEAFSQTYREARERLDRAREAQRVAASKLEAARLGAERAIGDVERWRDRLNNAVVQRTTAFDESRQAAEQLTRAEQELAQLDDSEVQAGWADAAARLEALRESHDHARRSLIEATNESLAAQSALNAARVSMDASNERLNALKTRLDSVAVEVERGGVELARAESLRQDAVSGAQAAAEQKQEAVVAAAGATAELERAQQRLELARQRVEETSERLAQTRTRARETAADAAMLRGQVAGAWGGSGLLSQAVARGQVSARRLVDCFEVTDPAYESAVAAALEGHLGDWVVEEIAKPLEVLTDQSAREGLLPPPVERAHTFPARNEGQRAISDFVRVSSPQATAVMGGLLDGVVVVDTVARAFEAVYRGFRAAVTPNGVFVDEHGVRAGGSPSKVFEIAQSAADAEAQANACMVEELSAQADLEQEQQLLAETQQDFDAAATRVRELQVDVERLDAARISAAALVTAQEERVATTTKANTQLADEMQTLASEQGHVESLISLAAEEIATQTGRCRLSSTAVDAAALRESAAADELRAFESDAAGMRRAAGDSERQRLLAEEAVAMARSRQASAQLRLLSAETAAMVALVRGARARRGAQAAQALIAELAGESASASPDLESMEREIAELDLQRSTVAVALARAGDEETAAAAERSAAQARVDELADAVRGDIEDEGPEPDAQAAEKAEREIVRLERKISALGPVNAFAPEEHDLLEIRVSGVRDNHSDLANASRDVVHLAALLTKHAQKRFDDVFAKTAEAFGELFGELFPGGKASLRLEEQAPAISDDGEPEKPELPGVEILAQPAGKRLQPLSLLSGGERALTALATILAMQRVNPSPFYVFDEVDAPLDDSNIGRFTRLLQRLSSQQQFIVVTHNHATMAAANVLYGVTIDSDGVSGVVSVRLTDDGIISDHRDVVGVAQPLRGARV